MASQDLPPNLTSYHDPPPNYEQAFVSQQNPPYYQQPYHGPPSREYPYPYYQPYYGPRPPNTYGPQYYSGSPRMATRLQPIVIGNNMMAQQQQQVVLSPQYVTVRRSTNHLFCCLICVLTGGLSIPCWICDCLGTECD